MRTSLTPPSKPSDMRSETCEVSDLIELLFDTEQRLDVLTRGEVDTVSSSDGRTLMLWRAQQYVRRSDATRQSVILKALDATADAIYLVDRTSMKIVHVNDAACRMQGLTREQLIARGPAGALAMTRAELEQIYDKIIATNRPADPIEMLRPRPNGTHAWLEVRRHPVQVGEQWMIVTLARDITQAKKAQNRIIHLNRVHAMLSGINTLIVRVRTRDELFGRACEIAAQEGGFPIVMIAMLNRSLMKIAPVASFGMADDMVHGLTARFASNDVQLTGPAPGMTMAERAVSQKRPIVNNDIKSDPSAIYAARHLAAGIHAIAMLPLIVNDEAVGVLGLYAREVDFFHEDELKLLLELTNDIAFALDHLGKQEQLDYLAYYDVLTGLANRTLFLERVAQYMRSATAGGHRMALHLIDVERFKNINDGLGQSAGDSLLRQIAQWIARNAGDANLVARVGADHFAVLRPVVEEGESVADVVETRLSEFSHHTFCLNDAVFRVSAKAGVAVFPSDGTDADTLFKHAEAALKKAKLTGERFLFYTNSMSSHVTAKVTLESQLRQALENEEFVLHYQPKVCLKSGKITGAEALIRWNDPRVGLVAPGHFIPLLEETGLIQDVGSWALRKVISDYQRWRVAGFQAVRIAVNVSPLQLRNRDFVAEVEEAIAVNGSAADGLELEITENVLMEDVKRSIASLQAVRDMGVSIAIDDFGTGFSSLAYLAKLPVDTLKIDRSFVVEMTTGAQGLALVSTIVNLAHALKLNVVAEGVETEEQSRLLGLLGCDEMQGFLISKAVPSETFEAKYLQRLN
jgi:diguanylate cyclase (GGDEF)-like protein/PAS domain S-box-containing protein